MRVSLIPTILYGYIAGSSAELLSTHHQTSILLIIISTLVFIVHAQITKRCVEQKLKIYTWSFLFLIFITMYCGGVLRTKYFTSFTGDQFFINRLNKKLMLAAWWSANQMSVRKPHDLR